VYVRHGVTLYIDQRPGGKQSRVSAANSKRFSSRGARMTRMFGAASFQRRGASEYHWPHINNSH
jgi:hypothetical protein